MRIHLIKKIYELFSTIESAHMDAYRLYVSGSAEASTALLSECQEAAISIGNEIEKTEGKDTRTEQSLIEYCEDLYQASISIYSSDHSSDLFATLDTSLKRCIQLFKKEILPQYEMVFLPYKASMWDSLESIYLAARNDPRCIPVVMPVPYFDRREDGTLGSIHYEGKSFPSYVPITDYQTYNITEHHPEAVFIHNPYDNANYITAVHPSYFSNRLQNLTELLVYVPYYVLESQDDGSASPAYEAYAETPAAIYSDLVIAPSEGAADIWINALTKATGEKLRQYWKNKILGLGSPKFDAVLYPPVQKDSIPDEWQKYLRPGHPVIFYNTSIGSFLNGGEAYFKKVKSVFTFFINHREISLLWRPHPLFTATVRSMRPNLMPEWEDTLNYYRENEIGILDETSELDRAIRLSSAYYGDYSSVAELFFRSDKSVLHQSLSVLDYSLREIKTEKSNSIESPDVNKINSFRAFESTPDDLPMLCQNSFLRLNYPASAIPDAETSGEKILKACIKRLDAANSTAVFSKDQSFR